MKIVALLFDGITALDIVGPMQVLTRLPGAEALFVSPSGEAVKDKDAGFVFQPAAAMATVDRADLLVVPGGPGTRPLLQDAAVIDWIAKIHPTTTWTASICTGSLLLAKAGILAGKTATTHWAAADLLNRLGANYVHDRVVFHPADRLVTAAGVSSGIDMALALAARIGGDELAQTIQLLIEYDPQPPFNAGSPRTAPAAIVERIRAASAALNKPQ